MAVTIRDVAARAGVSVGTVSNVLNDRGSVNEATVAAVRGAIRSLGYVRNDAARQLRAGRSRGIGLVVLDVANPFFAAVARGAESRAAEGGRMILLASSEQDTDRENAYLELFLEQRLSGVLISPTGDSHSALHRLRDAGVPVVVVDGGAEDGSTLPSVSVDDVEGGHLAVAPLLERGRRRIVFVGGPLSTRQVADRLEGARRAIAEVPDAQLDVVTRGDLTVLEGRAAGEQIRERRLLPDAVFAANDLLAVGILQALTMTGNVRVPEDVALVGYDDIDFASATVVPLTSVRQPAEMMGRTAVDLILRYGEGTLSGQDAAVRFRPELVVRASSGG